MEALPRPMPGDLPAHYVRYLDRAEGTTLAEALQQASRNMHAVIALLAARGDHAYATGKWSVKEVLQHVVDAERIFAYRALRFARNDATPLPGFEENDYAPESRAGRRTLAAILQEHDAVRAATVALFEGLDADLMRRSGTANGLRLDVGTIGWIIAGHAMHHAGILREHYLP